MERFIDMHQDVVVPGDRLYCGCHDLALYFDNAPTQEVAQIIHRFIIFMFAGLSPEERAVFVYRLVIIQKGLGSKSFENANELFVFIEENLF